ncbi:hypothetical protein H2248_008044 [Termitomyces sp. 'cryptogamus']|nr:hypothetical protein H2248_008044 [Termitomyces sp. 'cryptogamus']
MKLREWLVNVMILRRSECWRFLKWTRALHTADGVLRKSPVHTFLLFALGRQDRHVHTFLLYVLGRNIAMCFSQP